MTTANDPKLGGSTGFAYLSGATVYDPASSTIDRFGPVYATTVGGGEPIAVPESGFAPSPRTLGPGAGGKKARWLEYVDGQLDAMETASSEELGGYPKPPPESINAARRVAFRYFGPGTPTPNVVPSADGGVEFIWFKGGWEIQISVAQDGASYWAYNPRDNKEPLNGDLREPSSELGELLEGLSRAG